MQVNEQAVESMLKAVGECYTELIQGKIVKFLTYEPKLIKEKEAADYNRLISNKNKIKSLIAEISNFRNVANNVYNFYKEKNEQVNKGVEEDIDDDVSINAGNTGNDDISIGERSNVVENISTSYSVSTNYGSSSSSTSSSKKEVNKIDVESILLKLLAPFGVTKDNYNGFLKSNDGEYVVTVKNVNKDGKWNANDIKKYYVKDDKVVGVLTGDDTFIKVENGKLIIDESNTSVYSSVIASGTSIAGGYFATKSNYNTESNKEIFKSFYPNATDEKFKNFCDSITKNRENYEKIAESVIESNKDKIVEFAEKTGYDYLKIEDNSIKIDYKSVATELYAYESSKQGVSYDDGVGSEIAFNETIVADLTEYLNKKYSMNIDVNSIVGGASKSANVVNTVDNSVSLSDTTGSEIISDTTL